MHSSGKLSVRWRVLELGTGCGIVGISLAQGFGSAGRPHFVLTDLPEAQDIVERNIKAMPVIEKSTIEFRTLDWDEELPDDIGYFDVVLAADCTYNPDSR